MCHAPTRLHKENTVDLRCISVTRTALARLAIAALLAAPAPALAAGTEALFDLTATATGPFPSDVFTVADDANLSGLRVNLPTPNCSMRPSDCEDVALLNTLDGFNLQTRLQIPFSGAIDRTTIDATTIFLVRLGDTTEAPGASAGSGEPARRIAINQSVFDAETNTLFAETDELLEQHTRYGLLVTDGLLDSAGDPVSGTALQSFLQGGDAIGAANADALRSQLSAAIDAAGLEPARVVSASVFTTQSITAVLEKIRGQLRAAPITPASFRIGANAAPTVFPLRSITSLGFERQIGTDLTSGTQFQISPISLAQLSAARTVETLAFGSYLSPSYQTPERIIPPIKTGSGVPMVQGMSTVFFNLFLPAGPKPAGGWPVALFGHGFGGSKNTALGLIGTLAEQGIATLAINVVGHGGGPLGTLSVNTAAGDVVSIPAGGRGADVDGDSAIGPTEGFAAVGANARIDSRDGLRQTVIDLMQIVHLVRGGGMDVDGDSVSDLDPERIFYTGISLGGIYGTILLGVEGDIRAGAPNVGGGPLIEIARLSQNFRAAITAGLALRTPPLLNALPMTPPLLGFNENMPLRGQPTLINSVPGASAVQEFLDLSEWITQSGSPVAYARHIRTEPLAGNMPKPLLFQFARGDQTVPNPTSSQLIRAGGFEDRVTLFRNDLFLESLQAQGTDPMLLAAFRNPHGFLANPVPPAAANARAAQRQIALFFASNGAMTIDPDDAGPLFETPIVLPLPEDTQFAEDPQLAQ